jgi:O-antigen ligase
VIVFLALPWLNPFAPGPTVAVVPWLVSLLGTSIGVQFLVGMSKQRRASLFAEGWIVASLISALFGMVQYFNLSVEFAPWINASTSGEAFANLRQRNQFASLTNIGLVALLWRVDDRRRKTPLSNDLPPLEQKSCRSATEVSGMVAFAVVLAAGNAASSSRTGLLQLAVLTMLVWRLGGFGQPDTCRIILAALLSYGAATIALPLLIGLEFGAGGILGRISDQAPSCAGRITLWSNVLHLIMQKPWSGWGWGELDYAHFITLYPGARFCEILDNAHNLPLHLAVELGVPVASLGCGCIAWVVWSCKPWRERDSRKLMAWGVLAVIGIHSLLEYPLWYGPFQIALGLCVWILCTPTETPIRTTMPTGAPQSGGAATASRGSGHWRSAFSTLATAAFAFYVAWDYHRVSQIYLPPDQRSAYYRVNTLEKIGDSRLFQNQVAFAELTTTILTANNAAWVNALAHRLMSFSPEARVVAKLIDSAKILGRGDEADFFEVRFKAAYPEEYQRWQTQQDSDRLRPGHKVP